MDFDIRDFDDAKEIILYNDDISISVLNYGATLRKLLVRNMYKVQKDVVLGYDSLAEYRNNSGRMGATIGRFANRIKNGRFPLNGKNVQLTMNRGEHHIHGGITGFDRQYWNYHLEDDRVIFSLRSGDGDEGYPGDLDVSVSYIIDGSSLTIEYSATSDKDTIFNPTNHTYFNLYGSGTIDNHIVSIPSDTYLEDEDGIPTCARHTDGINGPPGRHDTCFFLKGDISCFSPGSGIMMKVSTDRPAVQFYTGDKLNNSKGKNGALYGPRSGMCFETGFCPDSPNHPEWGSPIIRAGERHISRTRFDFSVQ